MLDVIDFMEKMGGDAHLSQASSDELATVLADSEITPEQRAALLAGDAQQLSKLLGTKPVCILVAPPGPGPGPGQVQPVAPARKPPMPQPGEAEETEEADDN